MIVGAVERAFGARAVVAADIDDQRVIELALILNFLNDAANFMVRIGGVCRKDLGLPRIELLLQERKRIPPRQLCARIFRLPVRPR